MTFSIAALDRKTGMFGIAVASSSIAVGNRCPWARAGVGAVLTQHRTDIRSGPLGLQLLAGGLSARETVDVLARSNDHPQLRQFAAIDAQGRTAFFNGPGIESINSAHEGDGCISSGNVLADAQVTFAMVQAYESGPELPFVERLLAGLDAGVAAGGETQPAMAAALLVVDRQAWPLVDLRVDFEPQPERTLRRLWTAYVPVVDRFVTQVLDPAVLKPLVHSPLTV
jgi:uncharacterized Ntn-hydrolase superfamily protein